MPGNKSPQPINGFFEQLWFIVRKPGEAPPQRVMKQRMLRRSEKNIALVDNSILVENLKLGGGMIFKELMNEPGEDSCLISADVEEIFWSWGYFCHLQ